MTKQVKKLKNWEKPELQILRVKTTILELSIGILGPPEQPRTPEIFSSKHSSF